MTRKPWTSHTEESRSPEEVLAFSRKIFRVALRRSNYGRKRKPEERNNL
jgi:hypothetical protein